jgi:phosphopantetheinyl transferase
VTKLFLASIPGQEESVLSDWSIAKLVSGQPYAEFKGNPKGWLSLSHREGAVFCAWSPDPMGRFGVDLEWIEPRSNEFINDYLTTGEREIVSRTNPTRRGLLTTMIWSGKEAMLKALSLGLTVDTLKVETLPDIGSVDLSQWTYFKGTSRIEEVMDWTIQFRKSGQYIQTIAVRNDQGIELVEVNPSNPDCTGIDQD